MFEIRKLLYFFVNPFELKNLSILLSAEKNGTKPEAICFINVFKIEEGDNCLKYIAFTLTTCTKQHFCCLHSEIKSNTFVTYMYIKMLI